MAKRHRASSPLASSSADELLAAAPDLASSKPGKASLKTLIHSLSPSSPLLLSLPSALGFAVSESLDSFKKSLHSLHSSPTAGSGGGIAGSPAARSSRSPPLKRFRRPSENVESGGDDHGSDTVTSPEALNLLKNLRSYAFVAHLCFSHPRKPFPASDLLPAVRSLHDGLVLYEMDASLLSLVAGLCEEWWKEGLPGREHLISQSLPFLLSRSLTEGKKAGVRRVYALREAFSLFDYVDESIEDVRLLLIRSVITPVYLKVEEGRRFVAFMLGLNSQLTKESLALIRSQIPFGRKSVLEAYADILFRAWKGAKGAMREVIEDGFLQGLIEGAIHASSRSLAASVRRVLGGFVDQRATDGMEKLLFRLAEPLLFRSLQVANSNVRQNALLLLLDMFPLEDPDVTKEVKDTLLDKQFFLLEKLLVDDSSDIRAVAVEGICRILHLFWEVIPSLTITKFLATIVDNMSHDICNEVRLSTVNGVIYLLDNPQSHEIMKVLLPRLGHMFIDPSLSVRVAVVDLLLAIRDIRSFQFNKVVGLDALLSSLADDHDRVAQKVTRLLIPSYFPSKLALKEACGRCVALIKRSSTAGARFCEFALSEGSSPRSLMELVRISVCLVLSPKGLTPGQTDGLVIASANICKNLSNELSTKAALSKFFSTEKLKHLLSAAASERAQAAVLSIASVVSADNLTGLHDHCMAIIENSVGLSENIERQRLVQAVHRVMFSCGWFDEMFETLTKILQAAASSCHIKFGLEMPHQAVPTPRKKKVESTKNLVKMDCVSGKVSTYSGMSDSEEDFTAAAAAAAAAWQMKDLISTEDTRNAVLKSPTLDMVFSSLRIISEVCIEHYARREFLDIAPVLAYTSFAMYMSLQNVDSVDSNFGCDKNKDVHQAGSYPETTVDHALSILLHSADKLFYEPVTKKSSSPVSRFKHGKRAAQHRKSKRKEDKEGTSNSAEGLNTEFPEVRRIKNVAKLVTSILKFIVDAVTMRLTNRNQARCLRFASSYARHVVSAIGRHGCHKSSSEEEVLKDTCTYLKSSFTYGSKLLHLVLASSSESSTLPPEAFCLANDLLDLVTSAESYFGPMYASHIFSVAKPWLPVIVLGLGCNQLFKPTQNGVTSNLRGLIALNFPTWIVALGQAELHEACELSQDGEVSQIPALEPSVLRKLMRMVVILLKKGSPKILDAVGGLFLAGLEVGLEMADFGLVLGLAHFTCVKLLGEEYSALEELGVMSSALQEINLSIETKLRESSVSDDGRQQLESARLLVKSVLTKSG